MFIINNAPCTVHVYFSAYEKAGAGIDFLAGFAFESLLQVLLRGILSRQQGWRGGAGQHDLLTVFALTKLLLSE